MNQHVVNTFEELKKVMLGKTITNLEGWTNMDNTIVLAEITLDNKYSVELYGRADDALIDFVWEL